MSGLGVIEIPVLGNINLSSIDSAFSSIVELLGNGLLGTAAGGDAQKLIDHRTDLCVGGDKKKPYQRSYGDLECVYALLQFINNSILFLIHLIEMLCLVLVLLTKTLLLRLFTLI